MQPTTVLETMGQRIREVRGSRSRQAFASLLEVSGPTLKRYEADERIPDAEFCRRLCQVEGLDPAWLLWGNEGEHPESGDGEVPLVLGEGEGVARRGSSERYVPIPFFPHTTMDLEAEVAPLPHAHLAFSRQWLLQRGLDPAHLCLVEALGDGMAPFIPEGALLLVSTQDQGPPAEGIYLVWIGNRLLPKRIQPEWDGGLLLRSDNPAYENQQLDAEEAASFRIFGHVLWKGQSLF